MGLNGMKAAAARQGPAKAGKDVAARRADQVRQLMAAIDPVRVEVGAVRPIDFDEAEKRDRERRARGEDEIHVQERAGVRVQVKSSIGHWFREPHGVEEVVGCLRDLARRNAQHAAAIYYRIAMNPDGSHPGLVLIDDADWEGITELKSEGLEPCSVIETSPGNFQCLIRISDGSIDPARARRVGGFLNERFGDPAATNACQPGRLPGFTNAKPQHRKADGKAPFVRLVETDPGRVASRGAEWIDTILNEVAGRGAAVPKDHFRTPRRKREAALARTGAGEVRETDDAELDALLAQVRDDCAGQVCEGLRHPARHSASEWHFNAAVRAIESGFGLDRVEAWLEGSMRPERSGTDYPRRTARNAWSYVSDPEGFWKDPERHRYRAGIENPRERAILGGPSGRKSSEARDDFH